MVVVDFKEEKRALVCKQDKLLELLADTEKLLSPFQHLCKELYELILKCDIDKIQRLSLVWFNAFLGYKDECMVLSKGDLIRKYHIKQHKQYIHSREKERHYYNSKYSLTCISRDGIDYEYRQLQEKYPGKSMNTIANRSDEIGNRVDNLSKELDNSFRLLEEALKKRHINVKMILIHNGEQIMTKGVDGIKLFDLLRGDMNINNVTKEQSLTTTLDEDLVRSCQSKTTHTNTTTHKKRQNVIYDSDEEKKQLENNKKRLRQEERERRREETDFQMDVSLDQLKSNRHSDYDTTSIVVDVNKSKQSHDNTDQWTIAPGLLPLYKLLAAYNNNDSTIQSSNNDVDNVDNNDTNTMQTSSSSISKSRLVLQRNPFKISRASLVDQLLRMRLYVPEHRYGFKHIDLGVYVNWNVDIENKPPPKSDLFASCDDVFLYLFKYLLTSHTTEVIEFPSYIVLNGIKYSKGDKFNIPKEKDVLMHVHCYDSDMSSACLKEIITILRQTSSDNKDNDNDTQDFPYYLSSNFQFIDKVLRAINTDSNKNDTTNTINFNFDSLPSGLTGVSSQCIHSINDTIKGKDNNLEININTSNTKIDGTTLGIIITIIIIIIIIILASLLCHGTNVNIQGCGVKADHLNEVIRIVHSSTDVNNTSRFQCLKKLNMSYNNFLKSKIVTNWTPLVLNSNLGTLTPWSEFICMLFTKFINLEELDISNCADNTDQMNVLCEGLSLASKLRSELGLNPILKITINGVRISYPDHSTFLDNLILDGNVISTIDISGLNKSSLFTLII